jgi:hypothetical protein
MDGWTLAANLTCVGSSTQGSLGDLIAKLLPGSTQDFKLYFNIIGPGWWYSAHLRRLQ